MNQQASVKREPLMENQKPIDHLQEKNLPVIIEKLLMKVTEMETI